MPRRKDEHPDHTKLVHYCMLNPEYRRCSDTQEVCLCMTANEVADAIVAAHGTAELMDIAEALLARATEPLRPSLN
jgi:hypothetical protein